MYNFGYQLWLVLCLLFLFWKPKWKAGTRYVFIIMRLLSKWYNQGPKTSLSLSVKCQLQWLLRSQGKGNLILLMENETTPSIYETWRGSDCSLHDTEKYMGQGPKTLSLLSIMLHTEKGHRLARDSLYWIQMSPKEPVSSVKLPRQHQLLMKSWGKRGEEGYVFRLIFTIILQTSLFPRKNKMKAACL